MTDTASTATPLSQPLYGASLGAAFSRFWRKYGTFSGRASRAEFWWWLLIDLIIVVIFYIIGVVAGGITTVDADGQVVLGAGYWIYVTLAGIWGLITLIPNLALIVRRLHDSNHSGGWIFIALIPLVGSIILLVLYLSGPKAEGARFDK